MTPITTESLMENGFEVAFRNEKDNNLWLEKQIGNWSICYRIHNGQLLDFAIEADGGYDYVGVFDLKHFKYVEQIDNLIHAMNGVINENEKPKEAIEENKERHRLDSLIHKEFSGFTPVHDLKTLRKIAEILNLD